MLLKAEDDRPIGRPLSVHPLYVIEVRGDHRHFRLLVLCHRDVTVLEEELPDDVSRLVIGP